MDLNEDKLGIQSEDFKQLKSAPIDFFFHIAALTDFRNTPSITDALRRTNVYGTQQTLQLASSLGVNEFCFVGSAYSCGTASGIISPDYINLKQSFRNPYELSKLEAEILVRNFAKKTGMRCRYFRPSTICGRLIEPALGAINKFDVFYAWAVFFFQMKLKNLKTGKDKYKDPINFEIRICCNPKSGLNLVPADYAAKVIYQVCLQKDSGENYYLANNQETLHSLCITLILETLNIQGAKLMETIPDQMNVLEQLYYRTAGKIYTPYMSSEPMLFDVGNLNNILRTAKLQCPPVDRKNFLILMDYAKKHNFGLNVQE